MEILEQIELQSKQVEDIRKQLIVPKKIQLHTGLPGFESPKSYGVYRNTGGKPLGVVGESFRPMNLNHFLDSVVNSITNSGVELDISKLQYNEYYEGSRVSFTIPLKVYEIKESRMKGDVVETKLTFNTGFDGKTMTSLGYYTKRLWCSNGAASWDEGIKLHFKNTKNSDGRVFIFCEQLIQNIDSVEEYINKLSKLNRKSITQKDIDKYYMDVFGIDRNAEELSTRTQNKLDKINEAVAIEMENTGSNMFSLLNGITRFTTREADFEEEKILFSNLAKINSYAHKFAFETLN
jgi:hypothetical protein